MDMVNWGVGIKLALLGTNWAKVSTQGMFNSLEELSNYRIGAELLADLSKKSKMKEYNPKGFNNMPIFQIIANTPQ